MDFTFEALNLHCEKFTLEKIVHPKISADKCIQSVKQFGPDLDPNRLQKLNPRGGGGGGGGGGGTLLFPAYIG